MNRQHIKNNKFHNNVMCHKCKHYYVTWDKHFPHGCAAIGFKSRQIPNIVVRNSSGGVKCLVFKPKQTKNRENPAR